MISQYVQVLGKKADVVLVAHFLTNSDVGIYRPALIISQLLWFIPQALTFLLFPVMNELLGEGKRQDFLAVTQRTMKYVVYANLPLAVVIIVLASNVLSLLYGPDFVGGEGALRWLVVGATLQSFYVTSTYIIHSQRRPDLWMYTALGGMGTNVFLNYLLIPRYGINGAAVATACSYVVTTGMAMATAAMLIRRILFPASVLGAVVLSVAAVVFSLCVNGDLGDKCLLLGAYAIAMAVWLMAFERRDVREAVRLVRNAAAGTEEQVGGRLLPSQEPSGRDIESEA
jgi:O-antigen/teichoic acid export membrane protein